ncbi:MAG: polysaccharide biosynthesis/export family protein [Acidobacteria bacterium]|nr:polysaccharide biosynthesis/export family protein [Acidobacteriota bacterium]
MKQFVFVAATLSVLCLGVLAAFAQPPSIIPVKQQVDDRYRIGYQDVIDVQVDRHPDLAQRVSVSPSGTLSLFRLDKPVLAVCKTDLELQEDIAKAYGATYLRNPEVHVTVAEQRSQSISVIGSVVKPGKYFVNRRIHLLEMLATAEGPSDKAGTRLVVARTGSNSTCQPTAVPDDQNAQVELVSFKIRDIQEGKQIFWLQPGDVVSVLDADEVYVYGNVMKQGSYAMKEPLTLTQAIVKAEGLAPAARKDHIRILRQKPGTADREELLFDLNAIDRGKAPDPFLEPNDIVAVSEDKVKSILNGLVTGIKNTIPNAIYRIP